MAFVENQEDYYTWSNLDENDLYLQSLQRHMYNMSDLEWNNAAGGPVINVGGETFDMQPTLAWNQGDFFGQTQGFGASQPESPVCNCCRNTNEPRCCGPCMSEQSRTGIPQGMSVQYTQV